MSDLEHSRELQEKFELYLLGLIFTILALAIQTAKFGNSRVPDALEILAWISLGLSGLVGLSRLEWVPVALQNGTKLDGVRQERDRLAAAAEAGVLIVPVVDEPEPVNIHTLIAARDEGIKKAGARLKRIERKIVVKYEIHKWSFVVGLALLMAARAYIPVWTLIGDPAKQAKCDVLSSDKASAPHK
ncbi:hypothetical protein [Burkholderia territorii]|uniref:hypothetical protein n=1 Tax=Burkholderia territorii TaxID=1503055 RepID=UPI00075954CD|nr:hypothetical protein [Burkholderia territorii]KWA08771.1 hypothetical protein WT37_24825 [Burkholderia territorii]